MVDFLTSSGAAASGFAAAAIANGYLFAAVNAGDADPSVRKASIADETRYCIEKLQEVLAQKGLGLRQVVKVNCYLADDAYRGEFWAEYNRLFSPGPYPTRCTYGVGLGGDCRVQLDVIAVAAA
jgi:2-iminobutanoate/2-iminopropanoate deaminase